MRRLLTMLILAGLVASFAAAAPAAEPNRQRLLLDYGWTFTRGNPQGAEAPAFDDAAWRKLDLPHDWGIEGPFSASEPTGGQGGFAPSGIGWYRKSFLMPDNARGKKIAVEFDGVYENSEVWINGHYLGKRPFGYITFFYDLTPYLNFGAGNVIAVKVDNSHQPNSRWYSGSGIYRHVWMVITDTLHVATWGTYVTTPVATSATATVQVRTQVKNEGANAVRCSLQTSLMDKDGKPVQTAQTSLELAAGETREFTQQLRVSQPQLWSVDSPYLYKVHSTVSEGTRVADEYDTPIGIREIIYDVNKGCLLNGVHIKLDGVCLHHDGGAVGAAVPERVWERRLEILKEMGCNAIRTSHNPPAPEFLDLCDRMGFLVMDESFDMWKIGKTANDYHLYFNDWSERDVTDFVMRDRNHPSVALWSCGNEIRDQTAPGGTETVRRLVGLFHTADPTRPVTAACDNIAAEPRATPDEFLAQLDIAGYNYPGRWRERAEKFFSEDREKFPDRKMIGTEDPSMGGPRAVSAMGMGMGRGMAMGGTTATLSRGGAAGARGTRGDTGAMGGQGMTGGMAAGRGGMRGGMRGGGGRVISTEALWKFVALYDYVIGDFMWTGIDYLGETSMFPSKGATAGVIDSCGFKKDGFYFYQSQWTKNPMVHLASNWNLKGSEGKFIQVTAYTNCESVELFINGKPVGVKGYTFPRWGMQYNYGNSPQRSMATTSDLHLTWDVPYEAGTLKAVGSVGGQAVVTEELVTTGEATAIGLAVDRAEIKADRQDVAHVTVKILDGEGRVVPTAENDVTFTIEGPGKIIAVDNGNMSSPEAFKADHRKAFGGLALALVQAGKEPGKVKVTAKTEGLKEASIEIELKASAPPPTLP